MISFNLAGIATIFLFEPNQCKVLLQSDIILNYIILPRFSALLKDLMETSTPKFLCASTGKADYNFSQIAASNLLLSSTYLSMMTI